jgi:hypothetical protein
MTTGIVVGFLGSLVVLGPTLGKFAADTRKEARKAVRLLTGEDETEGDGVLPRLRSVESALDREGIRVPPPGASEREEQRRATTRHADGTND